MADESKRELRLGVIGCGGIANAHLRAITAAGGTKLIAVADVDEARAQAFVEKYGGADVHTSWEPLLADARVEAVLIPLPHHLHAPAAIAALDAGKHVLVEKPISNTLAEADAMLEAAERAGTVLMVGHMKRFHRPTVAIQRCIAAGQIGEPVSFEAVWLGRREIMPGIPWVMKKELGGGGPLMGFGTHYFDLLCWILGDVDTVACFTSSKVVTEAEVEDTAVVCLRFKSGCVGTVHFSWARSVLKSCQRLQILGAQGEALFADNEELDRSEFYLGSEPRFGDRELHALDPDEEVPDVPKDLFGAQWAHFVECVRTRAKPLNDGPSARKTLAVIEAAYVSAETGKTVTVKN